MAVTLSLTHAIEAAASLARPRPVGAPPGFPPPGAAPQGRGPVVLVATPPAWTARVATGLRSRGLPVTVVADTAGARPAVVGASAVVVAHRALGDLLRHRSCQRGRWVPVVAVTAPGSTVAVAEALERGADDCVVADGDHRELLLRIERLAAFRRPALAPPLVVGDLEVDLGRRTVTVAGGDVLLSAVQFDLLVELIRATGRPVPLARLLAAGWDAHQDATSDLLRPQLVRLRKALGGAVTIRAERGRGWVLDPAPMAVTVRTA